MCMRRGRVGGRRVAYGCAHAPGAVVEKHGKRDQLVIGSMCGRHVTGSAWGDHRLSHEGPWRSLFASIKHDTRTPSSLAPTQQTLTSIAPATLCTSGQTADRRSARIAT